MENSKSNTREWRVAQNVLDKIVADFRGTTESPSPDTNQPADTSTNVQTSGSDSSESTFMKTIKTYWWVGLIIALGWFAWYSVKKLKL